MAGVSMNSHEQSGFMVVPLYMWLVMHVTRQSYEHLLLLKLEPFFAWGTCILS